jgi:hypothetical protein
MSMAPADVLVSESVHAKRMNVMKYFVEERREQKRTKRKETTPRGGTVS